MASPNGFDLSFDDEGLDDLENAAETPGVGSAQQIRRADVENLPSSPHLRAGNRYSDILGSQASMLGGRPTSVPLFAQASSYPSVTQLRVFKLENGVPVGLGVIDAQAREEDLVRQWYTAMPRTGEGRAQFKLRPVDIDGNEIGQEMTLLISEHHADLLRIRGAMSAPATPMGMGGSAAAGLPSDILALMRDTINGTSKALDEERSRARELMAEMARERVDLASNAASGVQAIAERMMQTESSRAEQQLKAEQQRNQQTSDSMAAFFQSQLELLRADREKSKDESERARERDDARYQQAIEEERRRRDRDQQEWERRMIQMQQDFERKMRIEREEAERKERMEKAEREEREQERQRQHAMKLKEMEIAAQRDREHAERMMQLQQAQLAAQAHANGGGLKDTIKEVGGMLRTIGVEPMDLVQKILSPPDVGGAGPSEGWTDLIGKVAGVAGEVVKEQIRSKRVTGSQATPQLTDNSAYPVLGMQPYGGQGVPGVPPGYTLVQGPNGQPIAIPAQQFGYPQNAQFPQPADEDGDEDEDEDDDEDGEDEEDEEDEGAVKLNPAAINAARRALRNLVTQLGKAPEDQWESLITAGITSEPSIYHYVQSVTVKKALTEAGANPKLVARIVTALRANSFTAELRFE
jgi:hypothetical protein